MPDVSARTSAAPKMTRNSVEDHLGPAERRFFGAGYRRVAYGFGDIRIDSEQWDQGKLNTSVSVTYPADWSRKASGDLRPHLSTVDAILLAVMSAEMYLVHSYQLADADRRAMWVRRIGIQAASRPDEELQRLPVSTRMLPTATKVGPDNPVDLAGPAGGQGSGQTSSTLETTIGGMRVSTEIVRPVAVPRAGKAVYSRPEDLLGPAENRYYGSGFAHRTHRIHGVDLNPDTLTAGALVEFGQSEPGPHPGEGAEGAFQPLPTMVDCFVGSLQLAQILLYTLDGLERGQSNTLWMRRTQLDVEGPRRDWHRDLPLTTSLLRPQIITMAGARWRTAQIAGQLAGVRLRCDVAHQFS